MQLYSIFNGGRSKSHGKGKAWSSGRTPLLLRGKLVEQLPQLHPRTFQRVRVVTPVGPTRGNRLNDRVQEGDLPQVLENLGIFVVLNAVTDGLKTYPRSGFGGGDRTRRIQEDSIARS